MNRQFIFSHLQIVLFDVLNALSDQLAFVFNASTILSGGEKGDWPKAKW